MKSFGFSFLGDEWKKRFRNFGRNGNGEMTRANGDR
jgi:hypothetical protein